MNFRNRIDIFYPFFGFLFTLHIFKFFRQRNRLNPLNISNNRNSRRHYNLTKIIFATLLKKFVLIWRLQPLIVAFQSWLLELAWKSWQVATFFEWWAHQLVWPRRLPQTICTGIKNHTFFFKKKQQLREDLNFIQKTTFKSSLYCKCFMGHSVLLWKSIFKKPFSTNW